ncbi:MAG TPA: AGE family epimerase/isomerase [Alphaproteobacteria bacterium]|nr:AGE family epimerase/isomerase [Alphaproteobacteria bacterium]
MTLPPAIERLTRHATDAMAPLWRGPGWDAARGGFHERLGPDLRPLPVPHRRTMVQARQLFVFSRMAELAEPEANLAFADRIYEHLAGHFQDRRHGGWLFSTDLDGRPADARKDLYAHAFVMFGLAQYHRRRPSAAVRDLAAETLETVRRRMALPHGGFATAAAADWTVEDRSLNQNPHMHMLEACLAWIGQAGDAPFRAAAADLVALFLDRLCDPRTGVLGEYFDEAGRPHPERGHIVEPGHHFEWYWILRNVMAATGDTRPAAAAERMLAWAEARGWDPEFGGYYDEVARDGAVVSATKRIWPQLEAVRALSARHVHDGDPAALALMLERIDFVAGRYLRPDGHWTEWMTRELAPRHAELPASTPYHLMTALDEMRRPYGGAPAVGAA